MMLGRKVNGLDRMVAEKIEDVIIAEEKKSYFYSPTPVQSRSQAP